MAEAKARAGGIIREALDTTWRTPERVLARARVLLGDPIPLDAATPHNNPTRAARFCSVEDPTERAQGSLFGAPAPELADALGCGLATDWDWPTWINPPYGEVLPRWLAKIRDEALRVRERPIVALLPANRWEQDYLTGAHGTLAAANAIAFPRGRSGKGRLGFVSSVDGEEVDGAPYASMLLGFNVDLRAFRDAFRPLGPCYALAPLLGARLRLDLDVDELVAMSARIDGACCDCDRPDCRICERVYAVLRELHALRDALVLARAIGTPRA